MFPDLSASPPNASPEALLAAYGEVCKSYHAIDDFRMKLLGLLPFASLIGLILLSSEDLLVQEPTDYARGVIGFAAIFAGALTLALFSYEIRGIRRCHNLITEGKHIEELLGIEHGQFHVCEQEHDAKGFEQALNAKLAACVIYSLVFAAWLFVALKYGFKVDGPTCSLWALALGGVVATVTYLWVRTWTAP